MLYKALQESEDLRRLMRDGRGEAEIFISGGIDALEQKTVITSATISTGGNDSATSGVLQHERRLPFAPLSRRQLWMRDLLRIIPLSTTLTDFVREESALSDASPQTEGSAKLEGAVTFVTASERARTIAEWVPASRQVIDDLPGLEAFIRDQLLAAVLRKEQDLILTGTGAGEQLNGIATQATAFDTTLLSSSDGYEFLTCIAAGYEQVLTADYMEPTFVALHPQPYCRIRRQVNANGDYLHNPITEGLGRFRIFGMIPVVTTALSTTQFIVGSADPANIALRERQQFRIEISTEHSDYRQKNQVAILGEERAALTIFRPANFVYGSLQQSPA